MSAMYASILWCEIKRFDASKRSQNPLRLFSIKDSPAGVLWSIKPQYPDLRGGSKGTMSSSLLTAKADT
jgi:hypothetical protein